MLRINDLMRSNHSACFNSTKLNYTDVQIVITAKPEYSEVWLSNEKNLNPQVNYNRALGWLIFVEKGISF